jgi:hypothetical protein
MLVSACAGQGPWHCGCSVDGAEGRSSLEGPARRQPGGSTGQRLPGPGLWSDGVTDMGRLMPEKPRFGTNVRRGSVTQEILFKEA